MINHLRPFRQLGIVGGGMLISIITSSLISTAEQFSHNPNKSWEIMATFILFFALMNALISLKMAHLKNYRRDSIIAYVLLIFIGYLASFVTSGRHIWEAGYMIFILGLFSFCFILLLSAVNAIRAILEYIEKQDNKKNNQGL